MIHVRFHNLPGGELDLSLPAVPRQGDLVGIGGNFGPRVHSVYWEIEPGEEPLTIAHVYLTQD